MKKKSRAPAPDSPRRQSRNMDIGSPHGQSRNIRSGSSHGQSRNTDIGSLNRPSRNIDNGKLLLTIALILVAFLGYWRTSSRPLRAVLGTDRFTAAALVRREYAAGTPAVRTWTTHVQSGPDLNALLELLDSSRYRTDLGNLSLLRSGAGGPVSPYPSGTAYYTLEVTLTGEDGQDRTLLFTDSKTLWAGDRRFHPTDRTLMARAAELADVILSEEGMERGNSQGNETAEEAAAEPTVNGPAEPSEEAAEESAEP